MSLQNPGQEPRRPLAESQVCLTLACHAGFFRSRVVSLEAMRISEAAGFSNMHGYHGSCHVQGDTMGNVSFFLAKKFLPRSRRCNGNSNAISSKSYTMKALMGENIKSIVDMNSISEH